MGHTNRIQKLKPLTEKQKFILKGYVSYMGAPLLLTGVLKLPRLVNSFFILLELEGTTSTVVDKSTIIALLPLETVLNYISIGIFSLSFTGAAAFTMALLTLAVRNEKYTDEEYKSSVKLATAIFFGILWGLILTNSYY